jgi:alanine racemase
MYYIDSRTITNPTDATFVAIKGLHRDGHQYIPELLDRGVKNFIVEKSFQIPENIPADCHFSVVENSIKELQNLASIHRANLSADEIIGITGSNGKTIIKEWLYDCLKNNQKKIYRSPRSWNSQIGVALSILQTPKNSNIAIYEAGISQKEEMENLSQMIVPSIGIFSHLGIAHLSNFSGQKELIEEKIKLFKSAHTIIYHNNDKLLDITLRQHFSPEKLFAWGENDNCKLKITKIEKNTVFYQYENKTDKFSLPFSDKPSIENAVNVACTMLILGYETSTIQSQLSQLKPIAMRMQVKQGRKGCTIINDAYNADFESLSYALDFLVEKAGNKRKTIILSDIFQNTEKDEILYKKINQFLIDRKINRLIGIGENIHKNENCFSLKNATFFNSTNDFLQSEEIELFENEYVLLKGSRIFSFEQIDERLSETIHQTTLEVDLEALHHNVNYFRSHLHPETKMISMVKAYAYGSGDIEVSRALQQFGIDYLAVAVADEGAILRHSGIHIPIIVMNPEESALNKIIEYNLEPEIYSFELLQHFCEVVDEQGIENYPIHIKLDTGMHRLGFNPEDVEPLIKKIKQQSAVKINSVFSHLVGSDESQFDDFTMQQIQLFDQLTTKIINSFDHKILRHILNSAGIERFSAYQYDMVRLGIGHYGISAIDNQNLEEVCTLKTKILQLRHVKKEDTVGYSRKGILSRDSLIGAIPIGYADGYDRGLGRGIGQVVVRGKKVPIVGNVCMDVCMIDLTDVPEVQVGDEVILFGKEHSINILAQQLNTISYEILTGISRRVKRIYID